MDGEAAGFVLATVSTARLDKQKRRLSWVIVGLRVEAVVTLQASVGARTANIAGWRGCDWDWGTLAAWRRRGAGPLQCTMPGADRNMHGAKAAASGSKSCRGWPGSARRRESRQEGSWCYRGLPGWRASRVWGGGTAGELESRGISGHTLEVGLDKIRLFTVVLMLHLSGQITVATVILRALDRVCGTALGLLGSRSPKSQPHRALRGVPKPTTRKLT